MDRRVFMRGAVALCGSGIGLATAGGRIGAQQPDADLAGLKQYLADKTGPLAEATASLADTAQAYYDLASAAGFDYRRLWDEQPDEVAALVTAMRDAWSDEAHKIYESAEGIIAGVPSLAHYDAWIDAGPTGDEDPDNAVDWSLELPSGETLERPGNLFHSLTEPALWGTEPAFVGLEVDLDGDGTIGLGDALPEANILQASTAALARAAAELDDAVGAWEPDLSDAFTALVIMIPTGGEYFEQWKNSPFVTGAQTDQAQFVASSRLLDVVGIYTGLGVTWEKASPAVEAEQPALAEQITTELEGLVGFAERLYEQEQGGTRFTPEQADQFAAEVQARGDSLAGQITQAAALIGVTIQDA